jgi:hypothetical protein
LTRVVAAPTVAGETFRAGRIGFNVENRMSEQESAAGPADFSLIRGDLLFRLQRRIGLIPPDGLGLLRRAVFWSMLGWLPVVLWAVYAHRALPGIADEPLLAHFGIHARLLVAVPLLIFAEGPAHALAGKLLRHLVESGVVRADGIGAFRAVLASASKLRDSTLPWIVIVGIVIAFATASEAVHHAHEIDWAAETTAPGSAGFGGLWYLYVGRSIFLILALGWLWRLVLLTVLLWRIARLDLSLVPTHPDRAGGIGFLESLPVAFAPVVLAISTVVASRLAHDAVYHELALQSMRLQMIVFVVVSVVLFLLPLLAFGGPLKRVRRRALLDYGALVGRHGRLVRQRWIEGRPLGDDAVLNAPELGPVADTAALFDAVKAMRTMPLGKAAVVPLLAAATVPMLAVVALKVPVKDMLLTLLKALV